MECTAVAITRECAIAFLRTHLPQSDWDCYEESLFLRFVDHALALRCSAPWCADLEEEIFLQYVLFPRVNDEDLSFHREIFHTALWERVVNLPTTAEKVLEVNRWCHEIASYQMQDDRTASPLTVYRCGSGRCGEESAFLVSALRSVGIAARQVYAPRWAHCDDNHAWVEALCDGQWRFLGACEPEPILDRGWFNAPSSRALLVHSRVFGQADHPLHGERIGTEGAVTWYNQTARYALTHRKTVRATVDGHGVVGARVQIQVLNEASFHTIATVLTDSRGEGSIALGHGDFHVVVQWGSYYAECDCTASQDIITIDLSANHNIDTEWHCVDYIAPLDAPLHRAILTEEQKRDRAAVLSEGRAMRETRLATLSSAIDDDSPYVELFRAARGNMPEIRQFLEMDTDPRREAMLRSLSEKDLRDATAEVLQSHLDTVAPQGELPDAIYIPYVLCPRIGLEPLTAWRKTLVSVFSPHNTKEPVALYHTLLADMAISAERTYANLTCTPMQAWQTHRCDWRSFQILYVAILRTMGIPARLRPMDGIPEYYQNGTWHTVQREDTATLCLTVGDADTAQYRQNWTLSRREEDGWTLLHLEDRAWNEGVLTLVLRPGRYRLQTVVRLPNGNQFAAYREIGLGVGEQQTVPLFFRSYELSDMLRCQALPTMSAVTMTGEAVADICHGNGCPTLLFWLEEGGEPTEHILNELLAARDALQAVDVSIQFLLRGRDSVQQRTLALTLEQLPFVRVLLDDWAFDVEMTARHLTCDPDTPPLAVVCDKNGNAVYGISGYHVGSVSQLLQIVAYLQ